NRLNMIHEGTHGIQGMDLLGRKVLMEEGRGLQLLSARVKRTMERAAPVPELADDADALANAVPYMQAFGHTVLAWIWLDVALAALRADATKSVASIAGCIGATR